MGSVLCILNVHTCFLSGAMEQNLLLQFWCNVWYDFAQTTLTRVKWDSSKTLAEDYVLL